MKYRDNMSPAELDALMVEVNSLDAAYRRAEELDDLGYALWQEWNNMVYGEYPEFYEGDDYAELRRAALNHRGEP